MWLFVLYLCSLFKTKFHESEILLVLLTILIPGFGTIEDVIKIPVKKVNEKVLSIEHLHIDSNSEHKSRDNINKQKYVDKEDKGGS